MDQYKVDLAIYDMNGAEHQLLIDYVLEIYEDYPKMCENQIYQLRIKFSKWRKKGLSEKYCAHTADELKWESILFMKKNEIALMEKIKKLKTMYNELKNAREVSK